MEGARSCPAPAAAATTVAVALREGVEDLLLHHQRQSGPIVIGAGQPRVAVYEDQRRRRFGMRGREEHNTISGTSMATPHVAGCAALWAQSNPALRGTALRAKLVAMAKHLPFPPSDVGAGLVQAP